MEVADEAPDVPSGATERRGAVMVKGRARRPRMDGKKGMVRIASMDMKMVMDRCLDCHIWRRGGKMGEGKGILWSFFLLGRSSL